MVKPNDIDKGSLVKYDPDLPEGMPGIDKLLGIAFDINNVVGIVLDKRNRTKVALISWHNSPWTNTPVWVEYKYLKVVER